MENELLTINQVSTLLQISRAKVYELIDDPQHPLPVFYLSDRTPRFRKSDLDKWIADKQKNETSKIIIENKEVAKGGEQ